MGYTMAPSGWDDKWKYTFTSDRCPKEYENWSIITGRAAFNTYEQECQDIESSDDRYDPKLSSYLVYGASWQEKHDLHKDVRDHPKKHGAFTRLYFGEMMDMSISIYSERMKKVSRWATKMMERSPLNEFIPGFYIPSYSETSIVWFDVMDNIAKAIECLMRNETFANVGCPELDVMFVIEKVSKDDAGEIVRRMEIGKDLEERWNEFISGFNDYMTYMIFTNE